MYKAFKAFEAFNADHSCKIRLDDDHLVVYNGTKQRGVHTVHFKEEEFKRYLKAIGEIPHAQKFDKDDAHFQPRLVQKYYGKGWRLITPDIVSSLIGGVHPVIYGDDYYSKKVLNGDREKMVRMFAFIGYCESDELLLVAYMTRGKEVVDTMELAMELSRAQLYIPEEDNWDEEYFRMGTGGVDPVYVWV